MFIRLVRTIVHNLYVRLMMCNSYVQDFVLLMHECSTIGTHLKIAIDPSRRPNCVDVHARSYNDVHVFGAPYVQTPSVSRYREISVLMADGPETGNQNTIYARIRSNGRLYAIPRFHRSFEPLHYVLLHPAGDDGYYPARPMTALEYHRYRLHYRANRPYGHCLLLSGRLFHEYRRGNERALCLVVH